MEMFYERNAQYERQFYSYVNCATLVLFITIWFCD